MRGRLAADPRMTAAPRPSLRAAQLAALVERRWGPAPRQQVEYPGGAALLHDDAAWVLVDQDAPRSLGGVLVWAAQRGVRDLHVVADEGVAPVLARRAACFDDAPTIWSVAPNGMERAVPAPVPDLALAPPAPELAGLLVDADLEVVVEDGIVRGEILGLEVARIVHGETSSGVPISEPLLEVGVGHADRELTAMLHGALRPTEQLARVVEIVRSHRRAGAARHPLNQLAPERWLRARLVAEPELLGLTRLRPSEAAVPRPNLRATFVAMALGETDTGEPVVVACSVGVDLDLVPAAADARLALAPDARLLLVVPERDAHRATRALAARLRVPADVVPLSGDWRG